MFIEGMKIILQDGDTPRLWRFRNDQGAHRNIYVLQAADDEQQLFMAALRWGFGGPRDPRIKAAMIHLTDNDGDGWILDRSVDQLRAFKNRQPFDGRAENALKEILKDYLPAGQQEAVTLSDVLREYDLGFDGSTLQASPRSLGRVRKSAVERQGRERADELRLSLQTLLNLDQLPGRTQVEQLLQNGEAIMRRSLALRQQARDIGAAAAHFNQLDTSLSSRLEQEIKQLELIQETATPLLDPARSPKVLKERLTEVEQELVNLSAQLELTTLPTPDADVDWSLILQSLTRYLAYEKLEKATRKSVQDARALVKPVYDEYRGAVSRFLQIDRDLIRELEQCLAEIAEGVRRAEGDEAAKKDGLAVKLNKLLGWQAKEGEMPGQPAPSAAQQLDQARAAVNLCLNQIGKLYADLESHAELHDEKLQDLDERYEKVVTEYGKARDQWLLVSRKAQLPAETSLRSLINFINNYNKISLLSQRKARLEEELATWRTQVKNLGRLLEEWRTHTGSQKSLALDNIHLILAEARGVLQYVAKKKNQLEKIRAIESKQEAFRQLRERIDQDFTHLLTRWKKLAAQIGLGELPMPTEQWGQIYASGIEWLTLDRLLIEDSKALKNEQVFAAETLDHPLVSYHWRSGAQGNKGRIALLQQLEHADDGGFVLLLTEDAVLVEMIQKLGVNLGTRTVAKAPQSQAVTQPPVKTVMSEKAKAALEVFASRQAGALRDRS
jgi:archaellum component FlaC